jgi:cytochrome c-type biogenesis protein CcmE
MDIAEHSPVESLRPVHVNSANRLKFAVGGLLIIAAVVYLIWSSASASAQYFLTVDELKARGADYTGRELKVSGAVIGDSIQYDADKLRLEFDVAHMPGSRKEVDALGGMAAVLHQATIDPNRNRVKVVYLGAQPDLLRNEAQAIMTGKLGDDGIFYASELLLKCPSRYEEAVPNQVEK